MQRRRKHNTKRRFNLHSIPILLFMKNKYKSNVLYSIPGICILVFLFGLFVCLSPSSSVTEVYAAVETKGDSTASITLDTSDMTVNVPQNNTGYASKSIGLSINNAESYNLTITGPAKLSLEGSATTDSTNAATSWGYAYGQSGELPNMRYTSFDGSSQNLQSGSNITSLSDNKTLAFRATFAEGAIAGHYKADITLSLTATPKATTYTLTLNSNGGTGGTTTETCRTTETSCTVNLSNITAPTKTNYKLTGWAETGTAISATYTTSISISSDKTIYAIWQFDESSITGFGGIKKMQDMTSSICQSATTTTGQLYDTRDDSVYDIFKVGSGSSSQCWMGSNLKLKLSTSTTLTSTDSNVNNFTPTENTIIGETALKATPTDGFCIKNFWNNNGNAGNDCYYKAQSYANSEDANTVYYSWTAATAGAGHKYKTSGSVSYSICPKGWKLPSGGSSSSSTTDFYNLVSALSIASNLTTSSTYVSWTSGGLAKLQGAPYSFTYPGIVNNANYTGVATNGSSGHYWWSRTAYDNSFAYTLEYDSTYIYPGTYNYSSRFIGLAIRCVNAT